ncbi:MAG: hypothetical protein MJ233_02815 [Mycoplasmoidaceae bacterium]|nr:hypothetical protein [Mycoplasmoidaceae bacterium]
MKLKNKLIPIFATAATAGVVVPMTLTSCGNNITMIDTTNFTPDYEQCAVEKLDDANAATTEYMGFIKKNPSYFAQELAYGTAVV